MTKGKANQTKHDLDHVDLDGLDLENRVKKLVEDFSRKLKAKKVKEGNKAELKVNKAPIASTSNAQAASTSLQEYTGE
nr:hypothetical protein [Tanacetum cinerariifolium]